MTPLLPDVERAIANALRAAPALDALDDRIWTVAPKGIGEQPEPFLLVRRVEGSPVLSNPLVLDAPELQVDVYGGAKAVAQRWAREAQRFLSELVGMIDDDEHTGYVSGVSLGAMRYVPDEAFAPPRPRYVCDVTIYVRAAVTVPGGSAAAVTAET